MVKGPRVLAARRLRLLKSASLMRCRYLSGPAIEESPGILLVSGPFGPSDRGAWPWIVFRWFRENFNRKMRSQNFFRKSSLHQGLMTYQRLKGSRPLTPEARLFRVQPSCPARARRGARATPKGGTARNVLGFLFTLKEDSFSFHSGYPGISTDRITENFSSVNA